MARKHDSPALLDGLPSGKGLKIGIVVSEWNTEITTSLLSGCKELLVSQEVNEDDLHILQVPGSYELPLGARMLQNSNKLDAVICLGCLVKGETRHDEYIAQAVANGIMQLGLMTSMPVIFGVLTTNDMDQARERAGGKHGNKGAEAAAAALRMIALRKGLSAPGKIGFNS